MNQTMTLLKEFNFWETIPQNLGYLRTNYLKKIPSYFENNLIKVLVGQRRSGKSYLIKQIIHLLMNEQNVLPQNILYLNFELHQLNFIYSGKELNNIVQEYLIYFKPTGPIYCFFDEIQEVQNWEKSINSLHANHNYPFQIIITGSNSKLLSSELATYLTGRYIEKVIYPFSFKEYCDYKQVTVNKINLINFLQSSGIPELFHLPEEELKISFLTALKDSILLKDINQRHALKSPYLLSALFSFIADNIGNLFSLNSLVNKLKAVGMDSNTMTLANYLNYLEQAFIIYGVTRYDLKGKKILEGEKKYYLNDLGFKNYFSSTFELGLNKNLENYVYTVLKQKGYKIYIGNLKDLEIDFVAEKNKEKIYLQVTYLLLDDKIVEREYGNLEKINDNWPKFVISLDEIKLPVRNGIIHLPAWELEDYMI